MIACVNVILVIVICDVVSFTEGTMQYLCVDKTAGRTVMEFKSPVYDGAKWQNDSFVYNNNITIVNLQYDRTVFDYCDVNKYTSEGVAPLLQKYGVNPNDPWIGFFFSPILTCKISINDYVRMNWAHAGILFSQRAGITVLVDIYV